MDMTIPTIILFIAIIVGFSQTPIVVRDFVNEIKDVFKEGDTE